MADIINGKQVRNIGERILNGWADAIDAGNLIVLGHAMENAVDRPDPKADVPGKVSRNHPGVSFAAAWRAGENSGTKRAQVLNLLVNRWAEFRDGLIDDEIQAQLGMLSRTENPRRGELVDWGFVKNSGRTRKTKNDLDAIVWVYVPDWEASLRKIVNEGNGNA